MLGFTPFKRHANKFNYIPRYYDPDKEAREQRRAELRGERAEEAGRAYRPGQYIRTQSTARAARRAARDGKARMRIWKTAGAALLALLFIYLLYPKLTDVLLQAQHGRATAGTPVAPGGGARGTLDQSGIDEAEWQALPITAVPNDYTDR